MTSIREDERVTGCPSVLTLAEVACSGSKCKPFAFNQGISLSGRCNDSLGVGVRSVRRSECLAHLRRGVGSAPLASFVTFQCEEAWNVLYTECVEINVCRPPYAAFSAWCPHMSAFNI
jgi:hypothetical protein